MLLAYRPSIGRTVRLVVRQAEQGSMAGGKCIRRTPNGVMRFAKYFRKATSARGTRPASSPGTNRVRERFNRWGERDRAPETVGEPAFLDWCLVVSVTELKRASAMRENDTSLNFAVWLNQPSRHSFYSCLRAAVESLALDDGNLRERIVGAIFCLHLCRDEEIPERWRREVRDILAAVKLRSEGGTTLGGGRPGLPRFVRVGRKCKMRTARRIARTVMIHWAVKER